MQRPRSKTSRSSSCAWELGEKDCVRDPGIDETELEKTIIEFDRDVNFHAVGLGHADFGAFAEDLRFDKAASVLKERRSLSTIPFSQCESGRAARSVSAHLRFAPVGVEEVPPEISFDVIFY